LKRGRLGEEPSCSGGGEDEGRLDESTSSEQNEPDLELSIEEGEGLPPPDMLKYLFSWLTAEFISFCLSQLVGLPGNDQSLVSD